MGQVNNSTKSREGKHITYEERIRIEALHNISKLSSTEIGNNLGGRHRRTIEKELKRGLVELLNSDYTTRIEYSAEIGQSVHDDKASAKGPMLKIGKDQKYAEYLEERIKAGDSPYVVLQRVKNDPGIKFETEISVKTFYNYIDANLFMGISNKDLVVKRNAKKRDYHKIKTPIRNKLGSSISERPEYIDDRKEVGHWEMDTVLSKKGSKEALLVFTERVMRKELIYKIKDKTEESVIKVLDSLEKRLRNDFPSIFKSITCDNGSENLSFERMEASILGKATRTKIYYAHPYSAYERGSNENANKMIRRFIPKGTDIGKYTKSEIKRIENWMNNYPRKILGGLSANMLLEGVFTKLEYI